MNRVLLGFVCLVLLGCSANDSITKVTSFEVNVTKSFSLENAVNKHTSQKIDERTAANWINAKQFPYEFVIDNFGEIEKIEFDTTGARQSPVNFAVGDKFPDFVFQTLGEKTLSSKELKTKNVLLQFHVTSDLFDFASIEHQELENYVSRKKMQLTPILVFMQLNPDIIKKPGYLSSRFHIVKDSKWFFQKFGIKSSPVTFLLNQQGEIIKTYTGRDQIEL